MTSLLKAAGVAGILAVGCATVKRTTNLQNPAISIFIVDYPPGASAMLHRTPTSGYVLVHVLTGTIRAFAWRAGVGTYRAGQTWSEPAFANDISTANGSTWESARGCSSFSLQVQKTKIRRQSQNE